jgi:hypothetical protein
LEPKVNGDLVTLPCGARHFAKRRETVNRLPERII